MPGHPSLRLNKHRQDVDARDIYREDALRAFGMTKKHEETRHPGHDEKRGYT